LKEGVHVWRVVPRSTLFLFFSELTARFSLTIVQVLSLFYAFYILQIGGAPTPGLPPQVDPALQLARIKWGYVMIALFVCMIILSFPAGKLIDKVGRKVPLILANVLVIPAILLFVYGNYLTLFVAIPLIGFSQLLGFSSYQSLLADLVPQEKRGKVTGSLNFFAYIFMAISGVLAGVLYERIFPQFPFLLIPFFTVLSVALIMFRVHEPKTEEREA
jgi:MFS family permease